MCTRLDFYNNLNLISSQPWESSDSLLRTPELNTSDTGNRDSRTTLQQFGSFSLEVSLAWNSINIARVCFFNVHHRIILSIVRNARLTSHARTRIQSSPLIRPDANWTNGVYKWKCLNLQCNIHECIFHAESQEILIFKTIREYPGLDNLHLRRSFLRISRSPNEYTPRYPAFLWHLSWQFATSSKSLTNNLLTSQFYKRPKFKRRRLRSDDPQPE